MKNPAAIALGLLLVAQVSQASQSIVLGRLVENEPMKEAPEACPKETYCVESWWKSLIDVDQVVSGDPVSGRIRAVGKQEKSLIVPETDESRLFVLSRIDAYEHRELFEAEYFLVDAATPASPYRAACKPFDGEVFRADLEKAFEAATFDAFLATYGDHGPVELVIENEYEEERPVARSKYGSIAAFAAWFRDSHRGQSMIIPETRNCHDQLCDYMLPELTLHHGNYLTGFAATESAGCAALVRFSIHWG